MRFSDLATDNPNIRQQYDEWRKQRQQHGDATDWRAFRQHVMAIGAPDPGEDTPEDFEATSQTATSASVNA